MNQISHKTYDVTEHESYSQIHRTNICTVVGAKAYNLANIQLNF